VNLSLEASKKQHSPIDANGSIFVPPYEIDGGFDIIGLKFLTDQNESHISITNLF
jgi:hypothetical protein